MVEAGGSVAGLDGTGGEGCRSLGAQARGSGRRGAVKGNETVADYDDRPELCRVGRQRRGVGRGGGEEGKGRGGGGRGSGSWIEQAVVVCRASLQKRFRHRFFPTPNFHPEQRPHLALPGPRNNGQGPQKKAQWRVSPVSAPSPTPSPSPSPQRPRSPIQGGILKGCGPGEQRP